MKKLLFILALNISISLYAEDFIPDQSNFPADIPSDAYILVGVDGTPCDMISCDGTSCNWVVKDGKLVSTATKGNMNHILSKLRFRDAHIHAEFMLPEKGAGNSGLYIHGNYEMQIHSIPTKNADKLDEYACGALYGFYPPRVQAGKKPGEWQMYDILYHAPRRNEKGKIIEPGRITAWLNGQKVQDNVSFEEPRSPYHPLRRNVTPYLKKVAQVQLKTSVGPLFLQDHTCPVMFRNVWVLPKDDKAYVAE